MYEAKLIDSKILDQNDPLNIHFYKDIRKTKRFKVNIRTRLVYTIEIFYYDKFAFIKFNPSKIENDPDKYKKVGIGLKIG